MQEVTPETDTRSESTAATKGTNEVRAKGRQSQGVYMVGRLGAEVVMPVIGLTALARDDLYLATVTLFLMESESSFVIR